MTALLPDIDPDGLSEFSVVFTDRSLNSMSQRFQQVMRDISVTLKEVYAGDGVAVVPGGGTYGMEAVARQFATGKKCMVIRNGWFSYRWTQILEAGSIPSETIVKRPNARSPILMPLFRQCQLTKSSPLLKLKSRMWFLLHTLKPPQVSSSLMTISQLLVERFGPMAACSFSTVSHQAASGSTCSQTMSMC